MTPTNKRVSGNPARQAQLEQTAQQQRESQRQQSLSEHEQHLARRRRSRIVWWAVGLIVVTGVAAAIAASIVFAPKPSVEYTPGGTGATIDGVETFDNATKHVEGTVDYPQTPPAGGPHHNGWLNCGIYDQPQQNELAVHAQEHGAVWVTYDADALSPNDLATLKAHLPASYVVLSPYDGLPAPIVLSAWNAQLKLDAADDPRISPFFEEYWRSQNVPEPGAACTGGIDGPGRQ